MPTTIKVTQIFLSLTTSVYLSDLHTCYFEHQESFLQVTRIVKMRANCIHLRDFGLPLLSSKVAQRKFVITDVSGQRIYPSWRVKLNPWRWDRQFVPKRRKLATTMLRNIPEERRSHLYVWKYHLFYSAGLFINGIHFKILSFSFLNTRSVKWQKELLRWLKPLWRHGLGHTSELIFTMYFQLLNNLKLIGCDCTGH